MKGAGALMFALASIIGSVAVVGVMVWTAGGTVPAQGSDPGESSGWSHRETMEAGQATGISQRATMIVQGWSPTATVAPTALPTKTPRDESGPRRCGALSSPEPGVLCLLDPITATPVATETPIQPCPIVTPDAYRFVPCLTE